MKVFGAPYLSDAQPATKRPTGANHIAELANRPNSPLESSKASPMLGLKAAVENHIKKHQKKPTVAITICSTLLVLMFLLDPIIPGFKISLQKKHLPGALDMRELKGKDLDLAIGAMTSLITHKFDIKREKERMPAVPRASPDQAPQTPSLSSKSGSGSRMAILPCSSSIQASRLNSDKQRDA